MRLKTLLGAAAFGFCSIKGRCEETTRRVGQRQKAVRQATRKHHGFGRLKMSDSNGTEAIFIQEAILLPATHSIKSEKFPAGWRVVKKPR